jgi:thiamine-phosphate pyrophosphorylase
MTYREPVKFDPFYPVLESSEWLKRLLPLGIRLVQLRVKDKPLEWVRSEIAESMEICQQFDCQLIVNDYWQFAIELGVNFIHLGQEDLVDADMQKLSDAGVNVGISTHSHDELEKALTYDPAYIALGPVYSTILKEMPWQPQGLARLTEWKNKIGQRPLVGIGGLNLDRAAGVFEAGADIAALVTDITLNPNPELQVERWLMCTERYRT